MEDGRRQGQNTDLTITKDVHNVCSFVPYQKSETEPGKEENSA